MGTHPAAAEMFRADPDGRTDGRTDVRDEIKSLSSIFTIVPRTNRFLQIL